MGLIIWGWVVQSGGGALKKLTRLCTFECNVFTKGRERNSKKKDFVRGGGVKNKVLLAELFYTKNGQKNRYFSTLW